MNDKQKHRWYQFSLKTLMIVVTTVSVALGVWFGWLGNYRECLKLADAHEKAAKAYDKSYYYWLARVGTKAAETDEDLQEWAQHAHACRQLSNAFHRAAWQPWLRLSIRPLFFPEAPQSSP
ncbi:MAG: hypothetical protein ACKVP0_03750 [Pirellulaceae bacterium]